MAKIWKVKCKDFGKPDCLGWVYYSDRSYRALAKYGFSRPEYCESCQGKHSKARQEMATSYFTLKLRQGFDISQLEVGTLGMVKHAERTHQLEPEIETEASKRKFGVTEENIHQIYEWFKDPSHRVAIILGGTGSGKSTKFVQWLSEPPEGIPEDFFTKNGQIIVGQPRRVAASNTASYAAKIDNSRLGAGGTIGFTHGGEANADQRNLVVQKTHGQVVNMIERGDLKNVGIVMVDEAHDRSLEIDMILRNLKEQMPMHQHLKIIIASATIDAEKFQNYFGKDTTTIVHFEAKTHSYLNPETGEVDWMDDSERLPYEDLAKLSSMITSTAAKKAAWVIDQIKEGKLDKGDILVFMPGKREVEATVEHLSSLVRKSNTKEMKVKILPLYRGVDSSIQEQAINGKELEKVIRVVVSTNIAEASVTIESLVHVVETGLSKVPVWDSALGQTKIPLTLISQANARQRWGRAGRVRDGRAFTTYTKDQFEAMPEFPKTDFERLNLENALSNSRAAGLADLKNNWLDNPPAEEVDRAVKVLTSVKALDEEGTLTEYGRLLRRFNYSAKIVDLLLSADIYGCLVETATLIPIIRNGGLRQILKWDKRWSAQTKYEVYRVHKALMTGCHDDIEFLLKLFLSWEVDLSTGNLRTPIEKVAWAKRNFVNHEIFSKVLKERQEEILSSFYVHKRGLNVRPVEIDLIPRTRAVLLRYLGSDALISSGNDNNYVYQSKMKSNVESLTTFTSIASNLQTSVDKHWQFAKLLGEMADNPEEPNLYERILCEQLLPSNCFYKASVAEINPAGDVARLEILSDGSWLGITEIMSNAADEIQEEDEEDVDEGEESEVDEKPAFNPEEVESIASSVKIGKFGFPILLEVGQECSVSLGQELEVVVEKYYFDEQSLVECWVTVQDKQNKFKKFVDVCEIGKTVKLEVIQHGIYPEDGEVSLVTIEPNSGLIIAIDPEDMMFSYVKRALTQVPLGTILDATVMFIREDLNYVKVSTLPKVEIALSSKLRQQRTNGGVYSTVGKVFEIEADRSVHVLLDWSIPSEGLFFVVSPWASRWHKPLSETALGETYQINFNLDTEKEYRVNLDEFTEEEMKTLEQSGGNLYVDESDKLVFKGHMSFDVYKHLYELVHSNDYRRAVNKLYWKSNQLRVKRIEGNYSDLVIGSEYDGVVYSTPENLGVFVTLPIGFTGLVRIPNLYPHNTWDYKVGSQLRVKIAAVKKEETQTRVDLLLVPVS